MSYTAPTIGLTGLTIPSYQDILDYLIEKKKEIYGNDIYLGADSTDYQELSVFALMIFDSMQLAQYVYNNRGPQTAIGSALDGIVKINGLSRVAATHSTVDVLITGIVGTIINSGIIKDVAGHKWLLPAVVTIPINGFATVTATAEEEGEITALAASITTIVTPVSGWISVTNPLAATPGVSVETDSALRARQAVSTAIPSLSVIEGVAGAVWNLDGVTMVRYYENKTHITDENGIPGHSVAFIIEGGDATEIAETLNTKMTPGTGYYGTTEVEVLDDYDVPTIVKFFRPTVKYYDAQVTIEVLIGYTTSVAALIQQGVADYISSLDVGKDILWSRVMGAALLTGQESSETFNVVGVTMQPHGSSPSSWSSDDISLAFNEMASCEPEYVTITVTV
jgi:uncharacterized phage protein gp47/JayE